MATTPPTYVGACRCGHGRPWHKPAALSGWQRGRGETSTKTVRCHFGQGRRDLARCGCRGFVPQVAR